MKRWWLSPPEWLVAGEVAAGAGVATGGEGVACPIAPYPRRDVSLAEQLRQSPRLVLPRFRLKTAMLRPESFVLATNWVKFMQIGRI